MNIDELLIIFKNVSLHLQLSNPVYNSLFELFRHGGKGGQLFVLQFVPVLIWTFLSATTRTDEQVWQLRTYRLIISKNVMSIFILHFLADLSANYFLFCNSYTFNFVNFTPLMFLAISIHTSSTFK